jgi:hypothetical protein
MTTSPPIVLFILTDIRRPDWRRFKDAVGYLLAEADDLSTDGIFTKGNPNVKVDIDDVTLSTSPTGVSLRIVATAVSPAGRGPHEFTVAGDEWLNAFEAAFIAASKL